jgi:hypothetical protein
MIKQNDVLLIFLQFSPMIVLWVLRVFKTRDHFFRFDKAKNEWFDLQ